MTKKHLTRELGLGNTKRSGAFFIGKEGNACDGRSLLALSLILPLYMSGEELIWVTAMF